MQNQLIDHFDELMQSDSFNMTTLPVYLDLNRSQYYGLIAQWMDTFAKCIKI